MALRIRNPAPPTNPVQSSKVVALSIAVRQPRPATETASSAPMASVATSMALAVRVGTRDCLSSSRTAQARQIANAIAAVVRGLACRPRVKARYQSAARIAYSVTCPPLRARPCRASSWVGVAHGANIRNKGRSQCPVWSALPTSDESPMITAIHRAGGSQYFRGTAS